MMLVMMIVMMILCEHLPDRQSALMKSGTADGKGEGGVQRWRGSIQGEALPHPPPKNIVVINMLHKHFIFLVLNFRNAFDLN